MPRRITERFLFWTAGLPLLVINVICAVAFLLIPDKTAEWLTFKHCTVFAFLFVMMFLVGGVIRRRQFKSLPEGLVNPMTPGGLWEFITATIKCLVDMKSANIPDTVQNGEKRSNLLNSGWDIVGVIGLVTGVLSIEGLILLVFTEFSTSPFLQLAVISCTAVFVGCVLAQLLTRRKRCDTPRE